MPQTMIRNPIDTTPTPWYLTATSLASVPWLVRLRWAHAVVGAVVVGVALLFPTLDFPLRRMALLIALTSLSSATAAIRLSRGRPAWRLLGTIELAMHAVLLTGLLELTGGPFNPFAVAYAVPVALAVVSAGPAGGLLVGAISAGGYALLAYWHLTEIVPGHHRINDVPTHLFTLWVSTAWMAELAAYFVVQASNALARHEAQLDAVRKQAARTERLASLTTLAAGAAHELSTPLATIALAARELEHVVARRSPVPDLADDVRLIRTEVDRCRTILDQMSGRAGGGAVDAPEDLTVGMLVDEVRARLPLDRLGQLTVELPASSPMLWLPRRGLVQAVVTLVANALDATAHGTDPRVRLQVAVVDGSLAIAVADNGPGIEASVLHRAGEPFYTTKETGRGLGLGLFLARVFAERLGGSLSLHSDTGTTAVIRVPCRSDLPEMTV